MHPKAKLKRHAQIQGSVAEGDRGGQAKPDSGRGHHNPIDGDSTGLIV